MLEFVKPVSLRNYSVHYDAGHGTILYTIINYRKYTYACTLIYLCTHVING